MKPKPTRGAVYRYLSFIFISRWLVFDLFCLCKEASKVALFAW